MKTSLEIDELKVKIALKLTGLKTIRELVDKALDAVIAETRRDDLASLLGSGILKTKAGLKRGHTR